MRERRYRYAAAILVLVAGVALILAFVGFRRDPD
jgi:hypothetical protein